MTDVTRQSMTDDSGTKTDGTVVDAAFVGRVYDEIDDQCSSSNNTQKPKATTDEVISARGNKASLDARLSVSLDDNGNLVNSGGFALSTDIAGAIPGGSWVENDDFKVWCAGTSAQPTGWVLSTGTIARSTANSPPVGGVSAAVTRAGADVSLTQSLIASIGSNAPYIRAKYVTVGCYVFATVASRALISVTDGVTTSTSAYHTGSGTWEWLTVTQLLSVSATAISVSGQVKNAATTAYFNGFSAMVIGSNIALPHYIPCPTIERQYNFASIPALAAAVTQVAFIPFRTGYVRDVQVSAGTVPAGAATVLDVKTWDGAAYTSMLAAPISLGVGANYIASQPTVTARLGLKGASSATPTTAGENMSVDVVSVGATPAAKFLLSIRAIEYSRPQERLLAYNEF